MNTDGSDFSAFWHTEQGVRDFHWSPDGTKIVYAGFDKLGEGVCLMNSDGSDTSKLTDNTLERVYYTAWSPDGTKMAKPKAKVACITGEASIQMCIQELSTCNQYHLPLKIVNLNNRYMGMVRQWQEFFHGNRYAESYMNALPDFVKLAESYGHVGMKIEKPEDVEGALKEAFKLKDQLVFLDFITDQTENVFPMVPGGKGLSEMILV